MESQTHLVKLKNETISELVQDFTKIKFSNDIANHTNAEVISLIHNFYTIFNFH